MGQRSRACAECRKRRIGCDLTLPACRQCVVTNRICSGPLNNAIIINQTATVVSRQRKAPKPRLADSSPAALVNQPSPQAFVSEAYVEYFFARLTPITTEKTQRPWLVGVQMLSSSEKGPALDRAVEAAATVSCGVFSGNHAVIMQACQMYGNVVSEHCKEVSESDGTPTAGMFFTTVALSLFESLFLTSATAFASHLRAARKMLGLGSVVLYQYSMIRDIAIYVQYQTLLAMIIAPDEYLATTTGTESWTDVSQFQWVGVPSVLGRLLLHLFRLGDDFARTAQDPGRLSSIDLQSTLDAVGELWEEYMQEANDQNDLIQWDTADMTQYRDEVTAITVAYFEAARLFCSLIQLRSGQEGLEATEPAQSILACTSFLATRPTSCATLRIFFPLTLLALHSPSVDHRNEAKGVLDTWLILSGFRGLCRVVDDRIHFQQSNSMTRGADFVQRKERKSQSIHPFHSPSQKDLHYSAMLQPLMRSKECI